MMFLCFIGCLSIAPSSHGCIAQLHCPSTGLLAMVFGIFGPYSCTCKSFSGSFIMQVLCLRINRGSAARLVIQIIQHWSNLKIVRGCGQWRRLAFHLRMTGLCSLYRPLLHCLRTHVNYSAIILHSAIRWNCCRDSNTWLLCDTGFFPPHDRLLCTSSEKLGSQTFQKRN